jgi:transcriptional regulator with XRE-family HTH domain
MSELNFPKYLIDLATRTGYSRFEIARKAGINYPFLTSWARGESTPSRSEVITLAEVLRISVEESNHMLNLLGYKSLAEEEEQNQIAIIDSIRPKFAAAHQSENHIIHEISIDDVIQQQNISNEFKRITENLATKMEEFEDKIKTLDNKGTLSNLEDDIYKLQDALGQLQAKGQELVAPVILPRSEDMRVTLVSSTALDRLEEYHSEESKWFSLMSIFIGAILGIFSNWATGSSLGTIAWVLVVTFSVMAIIAGSSAHTYRQRGNRLKERILPIG